MKRYYTILPLLLAAFICVETASAQIMSRGDLFGPGALPARAGVEVGLGLQTQGGTFDADCRCTFADGSGNGILANLLFELPLDYDWAVFLKAGLSFFGTQSDVGIRDTATIRYEPGDSVSSGTILFNRHGEVSATYLMLTPGVRYQFFRGGPFISIGAGVGILMSSNFIHKRELISSTVTFDNGETINNVRFENGAREETLQDGEIENVQKLRLSAVIGGGYDIPLSESSIISPMIHYDLPLTTIREDAFAKDWKISQIMLSVGLKFILE